MVQVLLVTNFFSCSKKKMSFKTYGSFCMEFLNDKKGK